MNRGETIIKLNKPRSKSRLCNYSWRNLYRFFVVLLHSKTFWRRKSPLYLWYL